jgi:hypothetical protein
VGVAGKQALLQDLGLHLKTKARNGAEEDGTKRQPRYGTMTMVVEKRNGTWLVVAAQNDNSIPGAPPEAVGIKMPIPIPGPN